MNELSIYWNLMKLQSKAQLEYQGAFYLKFLTKIPGYGYGFLMIWIMMTKFKSIGGWGTYEVMLLYSLDIFSYSIIGSFLTNPCKQLPADIQSGQFDWILTKPVNSFFYYIFRFFSTGYTSSFMICISVMWLCFYKLEIRMTPAKLFFLILVLIGGALIQGAGNLVATIPAFWFIKNDGLRRLLLDNMMEFTRYPLSVYNGFIQVLLTLILPYAFINFYPAQFFLNKSDFLMFHPIFQYMTPIVGIVLFGAAYRFWFYAVDHYKGTGT